MVADDTKRIVVIKNISSNLIEEAILILRNGPDAPKDDRARDSAQSKSNRGKDYILKEAEYIINQYIKENGLEKKMNKRCASLKKFIRFRLSINTAINVFLISAIVFLLLAVSKMF